MPRISPGPWKETAGSGDGQVRSCAMAFSSTHALCEDESRSRCVYVPALASRRPGGWTSAVARSSQLWRARGGESKQHLHAAHKRGRKGCQHGARSIAGSGPSTRGVSKRVAASVGVFAKSCWMQILSTICGLGMARALAEKKARRTKNRMYFPYSAKLVVAHLTVSLRFSHRFTSHLAFF